MKTKAKYKKPNQRKANAEKMLAALREMEAWAEWTLLEKGGLGRFLLDRGLHSYYAQALLKSGIIEGKRNGHNFYYIYTSIKPNLHMAKRLVRDACNLMAGEQKEQPTKTEAKQEVMELNFTKPKPPQPPPVQRRKQGEIKAQTHAATPDKITTFRLRIFGITIYSLTKTETTK